jgi:hypothetical protein
MERHPPIVGGSPNVTASICGDLLLLQNDFLLQRGL